MTAHSFYTFTVSAVAVFSLMLPSITAVSSESNGKFEWQILTSKNFTSQIRLHPHILLFITVPWSGESRFLMREISEKLAKEEEKYRSLKLMLVHSNRDKVLAETLSASDGITILCYHHSVSYNYQGNHRVQDILSSVYYLLSLSQRELPLKKLESSKDLQMFLSSTDKAVLLVETCGWTSKLLERYTGDETGQGGILPSNSNTDSHRTLAYVWQKYSKSCEVDDDCSRTPWVGDFSAENGTTSANEDTQPTFGTSCSFEEYNKFESFFTKFIPVIREASLPPQRQRYGVVSDRLLLSPLGIEAPDEWSLIISYAGCPDCINKLKEEHDLLDVLQMNGSPVTELLDDRNDLGPALPMDKPSILLFTDRASDSMGTRKKSQEALHAFKGLALQYCKLHQRDGQRSDWPKRSLRNVKGSTGMLRDSKVGLSSASHNQINSKDKMSIVIINDGKYVTLDSDAPNLESGSLHEIVTNLLKEKKHSKLSSIAKEVGFQLLSNDIDIKLADVLSSHLESRTQYLAKKSDEAADTRVVDMKKAYADSVAPPIEQNYQPTNVEASFIDQQQKASVDFSSKHSGSEDPHHLRKKLDLDSSKLVNSNTEASGEAEKPEGVEHRFSGFTGSFFLCDGNHKFLRSLTDDTEFPRLVIVDPISQQHYVYSKDAIFSISSMSSFIDAFLNGSLIPNQRSGPVRKPVEMPHPPFVSLNFDEKDSIPAVTAHTFSDLVLGSGLSNIQNFSNAWHKDVIVLFTSSWCGFCQRMDLVVREVYRALKGYVNSVKSNSRNKEMFSTDDLKDYMSKLPAIYSIDCTLNDCGWILKSIGQREVYPSLLLFPAKKKYAIPYAGNMMVTDIIRFIANNGISSQHLGKRKGTLWTKGEESDNHDNILKDAFTNGGSKRFSDGRDNLVGATGELPNQNMFEQNEIAAPWSPSIGSFLVATDNLNGPNPFSEAWVLIVSANRGIGYQGLITNKPISWEDYFPDYQDVELLKDAPVSFGGPIILEGLALVSLTRNSSNNHYPQVLPGVYFLDQLATINKIEEIKAGNQSAADYWFFWGYSGWSWNQLYNEIGEGSWKAHVGNTENLQWP